MSIVHPADVAAELKNFPFFRGFPDDLLLIFSTMATIVEFEAGHLLLEQGKTNQNLYFLRSGTLVVQVDGENISELSKPGEVVGEMSLINRQPVTASVRALSKVSLFAIQEDYIKNMIPADQLKFQNLLDKVYATVLVDRLTVTNDKAKRFEIAHRDLAKAHEALRKMNENLEQEIARRSSELVLKVKNLTESHLQPTQEVLSKWAQKETKEELQSVLRSVSEVIDFLKPVTDLHQKGKAAETRQVLLCDSDKKQQNIAKLALGGTGVQLTISSEEELPGHLGSQKFDLILCDAQLKGALEKIVHADTKTPLVLLVNLDMPFYLQILKDYPAQKFFVSRDVNNRTFTIKNISTTVAKILNGDFFGMEKYLSWGAHIKEKPVKDSEKRAELIESMKEHFQSFGIRSTILDRVHTVTEELLMNAIYDAAIDSVGKPLFNHLPRTQQVLLKPEQEARLRFGTDGVLLAVSVSDPFGALTKEIIMKYLESCYAGQAGTAAAGDKGGAGRGLHMIIENSDLTIYNVKGKNKTEVICLFNLERNKEVETTPTFHLFFD